MKYAVVTRVPDASAGEAGNMAISGEVYLATNEPPGPENGYLGRVIPLMPQLGPAALALRVPVFALGEVLILDADGREVAGHLRKPGKWDVDVEHFDSIEEAVRRAREVSP